MKNEFVVKAVVESGPDGATVDVIGAMSPNALAALSLLSPEGMDEIVRSMYQAIERAKAAQAAAHAAISALFDQEEPQERAAEPELDHGLEDLVRKLQQRGRWN